VYYLSAEFLMGRSLLNTVYNLGLEGEYGKALQQMGYKMEEIAGATEWKVYV
jgi:starch phosphorylase